MRIYQYAPQGFAFCIVVRLLARWRDSLVLSRVRVYAEQAFSQTERAMLCLLSTSRCNVSSRFFAGLSGSVWVAEKHVMLGQEMF